MASTYVACASSNPSRAETSTKRVLSGRWKLVSRWSAVRSRCPGVMKMRVAPRRAQRGGAHAEDGPAAVAEGGLQRRGGWFGDLEALLVHGMVFQMLGGHGAE